MHTVTLSGSAPGCYFCRKRSTICALTGQAKLCSAKATCAIRAFLFANILYFCLRRRRYPVTLRLMQCILAKLDLINPLYVLLLTESSVRSCADYRYCILDVIDIVLSLQNDSLVWFSSVSPPPPLICS